MIVRHWLRIIEMQIVQNVITLEGNESRDSLVPDYEGNNVHEHTAWHPRKCECNLLQGDARVKQIYSLTWGRRGCKFVEELVDAVNRSFASTRSLRACVYRVDISRATSLYAVLCRILSDPKRFPTSFAIYSFVSENRHVAHHVRQSKKEFQNTWRPFC